MTDIFPYSLCQNILAQF
jgi:integrase